MRLWPVGAETAAGARRVRPLRTAVAAAGVVLAVLAYRVQVENLPVPGERGRAVAIVTVALSFLVAGLVAWARRRRNHLGPLMVVAGLALLLRQLRYSHDSALFTLCFLIGDLSYAL